MAGWYAKREPRRLFVASGTPARAAAIRPAVHDSAAAIWRCPRCSITAAARSSSSVRQRSAAMPASFIVNLLHVDDGEYPRGGPATRRPRAGPAGLGPGCRRVRTGATATTEEDDV